MEEIFLLFIVPSLLDIQIYLNFMCDLFLSSSPWYDLLNLFHIAVEDVGA